MRVWGTRTTEYGCGYCERSEELLTLDGLGVAILHGASEEDIAFIVDACNAAEQRAEDERQQEAHDQAWLAMTPGERAGHMLDHERTLLEAATEMAMKGTVRPSVDKE